MPFIADYDDIPDVWDESMPFDHPRGFGKWREMTRPFGLAQFRLRIATLWPKQRSEPYATHSKMRQFVIALAGKAHAVINGEAFALRAGDCVWMPAAVPCAIVNTSELPFSMFWMQTIETDDEVEVIEEPGTPKVPTTASPRITSIHAVAPVTFHDLVVRPVGRALGAVGFDVDVVDLGEDGAPLPYHTRTGCAQVFCIVTGAVSAFIEGAEYPLKKYSAYYAPPGERRALEASPRRPAQAAVFSVRTAEQDGTVRFHRDGTPFSEAEDHAATS